MSYKLDRYTDYFYYGVDRQPEWDKNKMLEPLTTQFNPYLKITDYENPMDNNRWLLYDVYKKGVIDWETYSSYIFDYFYHGTLIENVGSIAELGLRIGERKMWEESVDAIFVMGEEGALAGAVYWVVRNFVIGHVDDGMVYDPEGSSSFALLRIPRTYEVISEDDIHYDRIGTADSPYGTSWYVDRNIRPEHIDIRTPEGWFSIEEYGQWKGIF